MLKSENISLQMALAGFDAWGVVPAAELSDAKVRFERWLEEGHDYHLDYLRRNLDKRFNPTLLLPGARSVVVGAVAYKNLFSLTHPEPHGARIASYALAEDYHLTIKAMLRSVAEGLGVAERGTAKICVDSVPLAEKSLAQRAGIGWVGRNSLVVSPRLGSMMLLGELILTEECDTYPTPYEGDGCVGCGRCLLRCPTGAILPNRTLTTSLCISNRTIEQGLEGAEGFDTHGWFFGCEECQSCCPHNQDSPLYANPKMAPLFDPQEYDSNFWAKLTPSEAESLFGKSPVMRKFKK